jgi:hypothetical protein
MDYYMFLGTPLKTFGLGGHSHYVQMKWIQNKEFDYCFGGKFSKYL